MKNIIILTPKENLKSKSYKTLINSLNKNNIKYQSICIQDSENSPLNINKDTLIVSLGGDGTALKAMKIAWKNNVNITTLGSGRVGYLLNSKNKINTLINDWKTNKYSYVKRKSIIQDNNMDYPAFNEVVIIKNSPTRLLDITVEMYDQKVKLRADGIIISTSLGSTAYNYSAGGPIVHNEIDSIVVTPISPFSKFPRSIVINKNSKIKITINKNQNYAIQFDGVVEVQENRNDNVTYEYKLSSKSIKLIGDDNNPKLDHFLNQILR